MQQQAKISAFFKPLCTQSHDPAPVSSHLVPSGPPPDITYKRRRNPNPDPNSPSYAGEDDGGDTRMPNPSPRPGKTLNKKRSYAQYHLELGQSDFLLHSCSVCGLMYARGEEEDEKVHKAFHKNYYQGVTFKGWRNERVVSTPGDNGGRIVLVLDSDPPARKQKIKEVVTMMEKELGFSDDQLIHKLCKVYLFVLRHRIVGCLVAEPIKRAHRVVPSTPSCDNSDNSSRKQAPVNKSSGKLNPTIKFGDFSFQREVVKRDHSANNAKANQWDSGAILCQEESVPAVCGIRAIWVAPSNRRKGIASKLMDAARNSFCTGQSLEPSQCAFSSPTSSGKAFACNYNNIQSFLVYMAEDI